LVDVWPEWRELATLPDDAEVQREVHLGANGQQRFYELDVGPLYNNLIFAGRMLIFSDISERVRAEGALRRRMELQRLVASVATRFIHLGGHEPHQGIEYSLSTIGDSAGVDRCYLFQLTEDGHRVSNTHEWCAPGVEKQQDRLQDVPTARLPWWMAKLRRMEHIHVPDVEELPDVAANTRRLLEEQHIRSLLVVPVAVADKLIGFVGFDSVRQRREWTEEDINLLRMLAGLIGNALERQRAERALRQSQETTRALLNAPTQSALLVDREGTVLAANASPVYPSGRAGEELVGRSLWEVWPDELAHARKRYLSSTFDGGDPLRFEDAHGGHSFEHSLYPVADEGGNVSSVALLTRDVSERKRLEERLRQVQKMEAIGRLAGGVAHDFNNLLMVINGFADLLLDEADDEEPLRSEMEEIRQAGERAANLTRQLLAFSRRQVTKPREISLNQVIEGMLKMLNRLIDDHIALSYEPGASLGYIVADPGQIEQVLMNLAVNARDAINEAQRSDGRLVIRTWNVEAEAAERQETLGLEPGPYVALSVSDNGIGMGPEVQSHLFEPFFTTKEVGEGTGLGLAAVYGIVRGSGGGIEIDSEPGEGTTFTLYFPRVEEPAPCEALQAPAVAGGDETILVVEDSEDVLALTVRQLKGLGYHVLQAKSASEALTMVDGGEMPIDLVLTDVVMPEMSGRVLADRLRERLPDLAVVYMSGYPDKVMGRHGVLGADTHFVQKPFDQRAVAAEIRLALRTKAGVTCKQVGTGVRASGQG
jgi:PAS domain S-box-containing protein